VAAAAAAATTPAATTPAATIPAAVNSITHAVPSATPACIVPQHLRAASWASIKHGPLVEMSCVHKGTFLCRSLRRLLCSGAVHLSTDVVVVGRRQVNSTGCHRCKVCGRPQGATNTGEAARHEAQAAEAKRQYENLQRKARQDAERIRAEQAKRREEAAAAAARRPAQPPRSGRAEQQHQQQDDKSSDNGWRRFFRW
jgi:hypothetical protein